MSELFYTKGRKYILTEKGKELLISEYENHKSMNQIAQMFGVYKGTVGVWLDELGIERRTRKWPLNEHYFDVIDEPEKAYWLGFWRQMAMFTMNEGSSIYNYKNETKDI